MPTRKVSIGPAFPGMLSRRRVLALVGLSASAALAACSSHTAAAPTSAPAAAATVAPAAAATPVPTVQSATISTAVVATPTAAAQASGTAVKNAWGKVLPADAAPLTNQVMVTGNDSTGLVYKSMDFNESVYSRAPNPDLFNTPLTRIDNDFNIHPGHASTWTLSKDGLTWTFTLKKGSKWSDGNEVTANDYVQTFRYTADPKHAWDFTWYWSGVIKNYTDAVKGKVPTSQIGVKQGEDPYTLLIETEQPVPYLPAQLLYSWPLSAAGLSKYGSGVYNTNPKTVISSGPYTLAEWSPDNRVVVSPNTIYHGAIVPDMEKLYGLIYKGGDMFQRFQTGEIDWVSVTGTQVKVAKSDSKTKNFHLYVNPQDFEIWYAFFDVTKKPWDNLKVRQAFAHSVDRDGIIKSILAPLAIPAYGYLMPGYPSAIADPLKPLTNYDPATAKKLLSEGGYPNGQGFPDVTFYYYNNNPTTSPVTQALAAGWQQVLGVKITLQELDKTTFYSKVNAKPTQIPFGWISYGMDYFDASNMLGVYKGGGRHNWDNQQYDKILAEADPMTDQTKRNDLFAQAQKLLTEQAPAVFVYHPLFGYYYQPYFKGAALAKNKFGYDGSEWPGISTNDFQLSSLYIANNVDQYRHANL